MYLVGRDHGSREPRLLQRDPTLDVAGPEPLQCHFDAARVALTDGVLGVSEGPLELVRHEVGDLDERAPHHAPRLIGIRDVQYPGT